MKRLHFLVLVATCIVSMTGHALQVKDDQITFRTPDGGTERMSVRPEDLRSGESLDMILSIDVDFSKKKFRCGDAKETTWRLGEQVQSQLEVQGIVDSLMSMRKPRRLTEAQTKMLERVPVCDPYMVELKVIAMLLQGYDVVHE